MARTYAAAPIATDFKGVLEGLGNTVSNVKIVVAAKNKNVGLFDSIVGGTVRDVDLVGVSIDVTGSNAYVGGIAGFLGPGMIVRSSVAGTIAGDVAYVGGLAGVVDDPFASISLSRVNAIVRGGAGSAVGGLVGAISGGMIAESSAAGSATAGDNAKLGGLVGYVTATGVSISHSHAAVAVAGGASTIAGGAIGYSYATIADSYATGPASSGADGWVGGFVGSNEGSISQSFATGMAGGSGSAVGGFAGISDEGTITDCYATGAASGPKISDIGGFAGGNNASISASYSTGAPSSSGGSNEIGGFVGFEFGKEHANYWDTTSSKVTTLSQGAGNRANVIGIRGLATTQLTSGLPAGFDKATWAEKAAVNGGRPYLIANPPP
jgi:hypothetical protein